jgi:hypothetical protein
MTALQLIIKKAQALRKASPKKFAKWTDYVKAASATIKPKKKATVGAIKKKAIKKAATKKVVKKAATKKATSIHKDTKSHNVRISVVSGLNELNKDLTKKLEDAIYFSSVYAKNIEFEKFMATKQKDKRMYWNLKAKESKKKLDTVKKMITKLKKAI